MSGPIVPPNKKAAEEVQTSAPRAGGAGYIRIRGEAVEGFPLTDHELHLDVQQTDGTWIPFRGVCSAVLTLRANDIVRVTMEVEVSALDLGRVPIEQVAWQWFDFQAASQAANLTRWRRFARWVRGIK